MAVRVSNSSTWEAEVGVSAASLSCTGIQDQLGQTSLGLCQRASMGTSKRDTGMEEGREANKKPHIRHTGNGFRCRKHTELSKLADEDKNLIE